MTSLLLKIFLKEKFNILHETTENGETFIEFEEDPKVVQIILSHLNIEEMRIIEEAKNVKDKLLFTSAAAPLIPF